MRQRDIRAACAPRIASRLFVLLATLVAGLPGGPSRGYSQGITEPRRDDLLICSTALSVVQRDHLLKKQVDDEVSRRIYKSFFARLDPLKMYFLRSDIESFASYETQLDDQVKRGDVSFAYQVFRRYLERVNERSKLVSELLAPSQTIDFTTDDRLITNPDALDYPKNAAEARERWRLQVKYDLLVLKTADGDARVEGRAARERIIRRYENSAARTRRLDADDLLEIYLSVVLTSYEEGTYYQSPTAMNDERIQLGKQLEGIGAQMRTEDGVHLIDRVIPGGPAARDGRLKPQDQIVGVGQGESGELVDVRELPLNKMVQLVRGAAGSVVRLGVIPRGSQKLEIYRLTRSKIEAVDSFARSQVTEETRKSDGKKYRIGTIVLPSFYRDFDQQNAGKSDYRSATRDVRAILQDFNSRGVDAVLFDLRDNGGGSLAESISLTGLFIDQGPVLQVRGRDGTVNSYHDQEAGAAWQKPVVVLVNGQSASATEIFAGAIQDYGRGLVVGDESTYGKGTVQDLRELGREIFKIENPPNMGAIRLTTQQFYRPSGASVQARGIQTDIILPSPTGQSKRSWEDRGNMVSFDRINSVPCANYGMVNSASLQSIRAKSVARRESSAAFFELARNADRLRDQTSRIVIPLQEQEFRARLAATRSLDQNASTKSPEAGQALVRDFYLNEVFAITTDYLAEIGTGAAPQFAAAPKPAGTTTFKPVVPETPKPVAPAPVANPPVLPVAPAPAPAPAFDPNQQKALRRQQILAELLEVDRSIERAQDEIGRLQQEIAVLRQRVADAGRVIRNAENNTQGFLGGFAGGYFITQQIKAEQRLNEVRVALEGYRNQKLRLQQEQIGLGY